jgi:glutaconate CoA-transferase subunit B
VSAGCTFGEAMIFNLARTVADGAVAFHGYGSPLVQLALHLAKRTHAPNFVAGATYGLNPTPPFLTPTSNDWVLDRGAECALDIEELFDLAASGRLDRMFLSGLQIDRWGSANVTRMGTDRLRLKLPGGGGGCNLSCDVGHFTLWTTGHRCPPGKDGQRHFRLVERCDFVTSLGQRTSDGRTRRELGHRGGGPDKVLTELGLFDFDEEGHLRLCGLYPDVTLAEVAENTGFALRVAPDLATLPLPDAQAVALLRRLDPLQVHAKELRGPERERHFAPAALAAAH